MQVRRSAGSHFVVSTAELLDHVLTSSEREGHNRHGCGLVCGKNENAGITHIEILHIMSLTKAVGDKLVGIVAHPAGAGFMVALAGPLWLWFCAPDFSARNLHQLRGHMFRVFPHGEHVGLPFKMNPKR